MGLAITVGIIGELLESDEEGAEHYQNAIGILNLVLGGENIEPHAEPEHRLGLSWQGACQSFPYSFLHYLRRAYCCRLVGESMRTGELTSDDSEFIADVTVSFMDIHLLSHSDCEGFYVPLELPYPICDDRVPGGFVGSSQGLLSELMEVAESLGIAVEDDKISDEEARRLAAINSDEQEATPLWRECIVWFTLYKACNHSLEHEALIVFN